MEQKIITSLHSEISVRTLTVISVKQDEQVKLSRENICYRATTVGTILHVGLLFGGGGGGGGDVMCFDQLHTLPFKMSKKINFLFFLSVIFSPYFSSAIMHSAPPISSESCQCGRRSAVLVKKIVGEERQVRDFRGV